MLDMREFRWSTMGLLLSPGGGMPGYTHASHPCAVRLEGDRHLLIFSQRSPDKKSHIFGQLCDISKGEITLLDVAFHALGPGKLGTFDFEGLLACCPLVMPNGDIWLYYTGWNNLSEGIWLCDSGLATIDRETLKFSRESEGPIMSRSRENPLFAAATSVLQDAGMFRSWYNSGIEWYRTPEGLNARYGIHYAESGDGISWRYFPGLRIPFKDEHEHSFGRPSVFMCGGTYHMWFSCRGAGGNSRYRIGYASSEDGYTWQRNDLTSGMDRTKTPGRGFDGDEQAYPYVFEHKGYIYMLYSGNRYGLTGSGYAVLEKRN